VCERQAENYLPADLRASDPNESMRWFLLWAFGRNLLARLSPQESNTSRLFSNIYPEETEEIPNTVDRLKQIVRNFRDRRAGLVPGGCPLLNTAIDSDDGNPQLRAKARQALSSLIDRLQSIAEEGQRRGEVRGDVDSARLATLIASTLEGSIMVSRLQKKEEPRDLAVRHLEEYLETKVRARKSKAGADKP
jgi:Tetracyclin repressor-like, C-terminal domain